MNYISLKKIGLDVNVKSPTVHDSIPGLISCIGVTRIWGLAVS